MLSNGVVFFEVLLKFDGANNIQAIEEEIEAVKQMAEVVKERKIEEAQIQVLPIIDELLKLRFVNKTIA